MKNIFYLFFLCILLFNCKETIYEYRNLKILGGTIAHVHLPTKGYGSSGHIKLYNHLKKLGINSVQLNPFAYQKNIATIKLKWNDPTMTEEHILKEIDLAHRTGMSVMLKPHIWLGGWKSKEWRSQIDYEDSSKLSLWFKEYSRFIKKQLNIAISGNVEYFVIGTELVKLTKYKKEWENIISMVRESNYKGKITYACEAWNAKNILFWDKLDFIGLDFYYGFRGDEKDHESLKSFYKQKLIAHMEHAKKFQKPIIFTEIGFPSHEFAIRKPYSWPSAKYNIDDQKQTLGYKMIRNAMEETFFPHGIYFWKYVTSLDSYEYKSYPRGFQLQGKPAEKEIKIFSQKIK